MSEGDDRFWGGVWWVVGDDGRLRTATPGKERSMTMSAWRDYGLHGRIAGVVTLDNHPNGLFAKLEEGVWYLWDDPEQKLTWYTSMPSCWRIATPYEITEIETARTSS